MAYTDFESDGVEYRLILSRHGSKRKEPIGGLDALVLETGSMDPASYAAYVSEREEIANYLDIIKEQDIPIYSVDNSGKNFLLNMATSVAHMFSPALMTYGISKLAGANNDTAYNMALATACAECAIVGIPSFCGNGVSKIFAKINSYLSLIRQAPREELRNAVISRKIKKGVVPHLKENYPERFVDRSPRIGIIYGSGHSGIKECLENNLRAGFSLGLHKHYGLRFILDKNSLKDIYEYNLNKDGNVTYRKFQIDSI